MVERLRVCQPQQRSDACSPPESVMVALFDSPSLLLRVTCLGSFSRGTPTKIHQVFFFFKRIFTSIFVLVFRRTMRSKLSSALLFSRFIGHHWHLHVLA